MRILPETRRSRLRRRSGASIGAHVLQDGTGARLRRRSGEEVRRWRSLSDSRSRGARSRRCRLDRDTVFWDRELTGFGVRVYPSGSKYYIVQVRGPEGSKRLTVGRHGVITADRGAAAGGADHRPDQGRGGPDPGAHARRPRTARRSARSRCATLSSMWRCAAGRRHGGHVPAQDRALHPAGLRHVAAFRRSAARDVAGPALRAPRQAGAGEPMLSRSCRACSPWRSTGALRPRAANPCRFVKPPPGAPARALPDGGGVRPPGPGSRRGGDGRPGDAEHGGGDQAIDADRMPGAARSWSFSGTDVDLERRELRLRQTKTGTRARCR